MVRDSLGLGVRRDGGRKRGKGRRGINSPFLAILGEIESREGGLGGFVVDGAERRCGGEVWRRGGHVIQLTDSG